MSSRTIKTIKPVIFLLLFGFTCFPSIAQIVDIPDPEFKRALTKSYCAGTNAANLEDVDRNNDGEIQVEEAERITILKFRQNRKVHKIKSFAGLSAFKNLKTLILYGGKAESLQLKNLDSLEHLTLGILWLKNLELSHLPKLDSLYLSCDSLKSAQWNHLPQLKTLYLNCPLLQFDGTNLSQLEKFSCKYSKRTSLNLKGLHQLKELDCSYNQLTSLDLSDLVQLRKLDCSKNKLTNIKTSGIAQLRRLKCFENQLSTLDIVKNKALEVLECYDNQLKTLPLDGLTKLKRLSVSKNQLKELSLEDSKSLRFLNCGSNQLSKLSLPDLPELMYCYLNNNALEHINLSKSKKLERLSISNNKLKNIDLTENVNLSELMCNDNQLSELNIKFLKDLKQVDCKNNSLKQLDLEGLSNLNRVYCSNNHLSLINLMGLNNLENLHCQNNQLEEIKLEDLKRVKEIKCQNNQLKNLGIHYLVNLRNLDCSNNQIREILITEAPSLGSLNCSNNQLNELDLSELPRLSNVDCSNAQVQKLNISGSTNLTKLNCSTNPLLALYAKGISYKLKPDFNGCRTLMHICADESQFSKVNYWMKKHTIIDYEVQSDCKSDFSEQEIQLAQQKALYADKLHLIKLDSLANIELIAKAKEDSIKNSWTPNCDFPKLKIITKRDSPCSKYYTLSTSEKYDEYEWWSENSRRRPSREETTSVRSGLYKLRVKKGSCVSTFDSIYVEKHTELDAFILQDEHLPTCVEPRLLEAWTNRAVISYQWLYQDSLVSTDKSFTATKGGDYTLIVSDSLGCTVSDQTKILDGLTEYANNDLYRIEKEKNNICQGDSLALTCTLAGLPAGFGGPFEWYNEKGSLLSSTERCIVKSPGNYTVKITNEHGCQRSKPVQIYDCKDPNRTLEPQKIFKRQALSFEPDIKQSFYNNFAMRDSFIQMCQYTIDTLNTIEHKTEEQLRSLEYASGILKDSLLLELMLGNAYASQEDNILNLKEMPVFGWCKNEEDPEACKNQLLIDATARFFINPNEDAPSNDLGWLGSFPPIYKAFAFFDSTNKLSIRIDGTYNFTFQFDIIEDYLTAQYSELGDLNYKYFAKEGFSPHLTHVPINIEKFVLNTQDWKQGAPLYGYCELSVDPFYVDLELGQPLHLQRSFKLYFKTKAVNLEKAMNLEKEK